MGYAYKVTSPILKLILTTLHIHVGFICKTPLIFVKTKCQEDLDHSFKSQLMNMFKISSKENTSIKISNREIMTDKINTREQEVLYLIAHEYNSKEIAIELFINEHTAITHRKNLLTKMDVKNTAGLIRRGFEKGFLQLIFQDYRNLCDINDQITSYLIFYRQDSK